MSCKPLLSVLIPAYDDPKGVKRILDLVCSELYNGLSLECIVSDDSRSSDVECMVAEHPINAFEMFRFIRNCPGLGAAANWNFLLEVSSGEFFLFMHHDEFPYEVNFFSRLANLLRQQDSSDVVILKCCVPTIIPNIFRSHVPLWVAKFYFSLGPNSILHKNFIGSPSNFCVRRSMLKKFDERLQWLIDVDWYCRIFNIPEIKVSFSNLRVLSVFNANSIAASLSPDKSKLRESESKLIFFLAGSEMVFQRDLSARILAFSEVFLWPVVRIVSIPFSTIMGFYVSRNVIDSNDLSTLN